jgi:hypothetical protein
LILVSCVLKSARVDGAAGGLHRFFELVRFALAERGAVVDDRDAFRLGRLHCVGAGIAGVLRVGGDHHEGVRKAAVRNDRVGRRRVDHRDAGRFIDLRGWNRGA